MWSREKEPTHAQIEQVKAIMERREKEKKPIDYVIKDVRALVEMRQLQLRQVNTEMASIRAHYQQGHLHGGGKFGGFVRIVQRGTKNAKLKELQKSKEVKQLMIMQLEQCLSRLKMAKGQGVLYCAFGDFFGLG